MSAPPPPRIPRIDSADNARLKQARRLGRDARERRALGACLVEGIRGASECVRAGARVRLALVSPRLEELPGGIELRQLLLDRLGSDPDALRETSDELLASLAAARTSQGVVLVADPPPPPPLPAAGEALLVAWSVADPGNVGTLVRTCEAAGLDGLVLAGEPGSPPADPTSPRAVRAAAGSLFRRPPIPWSGSASELLDTLEAAGWTTVACLPRDGRAPEDIELTGGAASILGAETRGLPSIVSERASRRLTVPLHGAAESLNVAAAGAVIAFEAARQRRVAASRGR